MRLLIVQEIILFVLVIFLVRRERFCVILNGSGKLLEDIIFLLIRALKTMKRRYGRVFTGIFYRFILKIVLKITMFLVLKTRLIFIRGIQFCLFKLCCRQQWEGRGKLGCLKGILYSAIVFLKRKCLFLSNLMKELEFILWNLPWQKWGLLFLKRMLKMLKLHYGYSMFKNLHGIFWTEKLRWLR